MTDQSSRFRKGGIYTMDIRRRGMGVVPHTPTGPRITPNIQPAGAGWGAVPGTIVGPGTGVVPVALRDRVSNAAKAGAELSWKNRGVASALSSLGASLMRIAVDGNGQVSGQAVKAQMDFILANQEIVQRLNDGLAQIWPGQTVQTVELMLVNQPSSTSGTQAAAQFNWRANFNPGATGMTQGSGPQTAARNAGHAITSGGGGTDVAQSAMTPGVNAAMDARATQVDAGPMSPYTGPGDYEAARRDDVGRDADALPLTCPPGYYMVLGVCQPISPEADPRPWLSCQGHWDPATMRCVDRADAPAWRAPTWLVPVLAAMGGAALGAVTIRALVG